MKQYKIESIKKRVRDMLQRVSLWTPSFSSSEKEFELFSIPWNIDGLTVQMAEMKRIRPCYFSD
jgi:hypothetical protein